MADIIKVTSNVRRTMTTAFPSHSGNVYMEEKKSQENGILIWHIYASAPTQGNFTTTDTNVKAIFLFDITGANAAKVSYDQGSTWAALHA